MSTLRQAPLTIAEAATLIAARRLSPVELIEACLERTAALDRHLHAFIHLDAEAAFEAARVAEREIMAGHYRGALHGIPIAFKDIFDVAGVPTTAHSRLLKDNVPASDATVVQRLTEGGAVSLGKLAMHEFALGGPSFDLPWPPARNPWDAARFTFGSSSGSAAAIAAGLILGGPGTDTAGSIRGPAAFCGIAGLKPTYGLVSRAGVFPLAPSLDHVGPMAWTVEDCAILLQAMAGHDPADPTSVDRELPDFRASLSGDLRGVRIGVVRHFHETDNRLSPAMQAALDEALDVLRSLGAALRDVTLAPLADYAAAGAVLMTAEAYAIHAANLRERPHDYGRIFRNRISSGIFYDAGDYAQAARLRGRLRRGFADVMASHDVLVTAVMPGEAPPIDKVPPWPNPERPSLMTPFNLIGNPALAVCCGFSDAGLPLSLQIAGKAFDDATVLRVGHAYECASAWRERRPAILSAAASIRGAAHGD